MKEKTKFRILLHYTYFVDGLNLQSLFKYYIVGIIGASAVNAGFSIPVLVIGALAHGIVTYLAGRWFAMHGWKEQSQEVSNYFNKFVHETRNFIKKNGKKKS